ncbi:MAG: DUF362 domain-containing protein, partial [Verrucomicrobiota bacterium]|nr:DUF362 domain-containing protein [Verrucomicrobiota bacterium]
MAAAASACAQSPAATPSVVYVAHDADAIKNYKTNPAIVRAMVNRLVMAVTKQADVASAWRSLVSPKDKVGIKISAAGGEIFATHRDVVNAIVDGLVAAGHARESIVVWDRTLGGAHAAGYGNEGYRLVGVLGYGGYDPKVSISGPLLGNLVWGDHDYHGGITSVPLSDGQNMSVTSYVAKVLTQDVTKVINVPVLSDSETNGVAGCIYNMTVPNIDNWRRFTQSTHFAAGSLAEIYGNPAIGSKVVLNIMDGLIAEYAGGPASHPNYQKHFDTIYASRDPVAIDSIALKKIEEWRRLASLG